MRYGVEGRLIDFGQGCEVPLAQLIDELLDWVDEVLDELGCRREAEYARTIVAEGASADRQLAVWRETGSLEAVVDRVVEETLAGC